MERKKLLKKMAVMAICFIVITVIGFIFESSYYYTMKKQKIEKRQSHIATLTEYYQKYLDKVSSSIKDLAIGADISSRIQSEILRQQSKTKLYLWMSDTRGDFVFGTPSPVFNRMNKIFDRYRNLFEKNNDYVDRNDFLLQLVNHHDRMNFSRFDLKSDINSMESWRYFLSHRINLPPSNTTVVNLSSPVFNADNQTIGDLYLKVEDSNLKSPYLVYESDFIEDFFEFLHVLFGFSIFFLWVLIPSYVYIDARQHEQRNAFKWALLTVISFGFAAIVYLIVRSPVQKNFQCPECRKELNGTKSFCPYCGFDLSATFCPQCQYPLRPEWQFCPSCRFDIRQNTVKEKKKNSKETEK